MKLLFISIFFITSVIGDSLHYAPSSMHTQVKAYTIQLLSTRDNKVAKKYINTIPKKMKKKAYIFKDKKYIALRYGITTTHSQLEPALIKLKKSGFYDAFIIGINSIPQAQVKDNKPHQEKISKFVQSKMILKAQKAYKNGDETTALLYYEMLYNTGKVNSKILNNLCYLYGKRGAWFDAQKIIDKQRYTTKLLYAYAYGAVQTNQKNFIINISPYIILDRRGRIALLAGSYFENQHDLDKALGYYKMAYNKNPSDFYNIFAYARALDLNKHYTLALQYYEKAISKAKNKNMLNIITHRVSQL